jgi:hypothetical protein
LGLDIQVFHFVGQVFFVNACRHVCPINLAHLTYRPRVAEKLLEVTSNSCRVKYGPCITGHIAFELIFQKIFNLHILTAAPQQEKPMENQHGTL